MGDGGCGGTGCGSQEASTPAATTAAKASTNRGGTAGGCIDGTARDGITELGTGDGQRGRLTTTVGAAEVEGGCAAAPRTGTCATAPTASDGGHWAEDVVHAFAAHDFVADGGDIRDVEEAANAIASPKGNDGHPEQKLGGEPGEDLGQGSAAEKAANRAPAPSQDCGRPVRCQSAAAPPNESSGDGEADSSPAEANLTGGGVKGG